MRMRNMLFHPLLQFDYEEFVSQELSKGTAFSNVEVLKVRNLVNHRPLPPQSEDYSKLRISITTVEPPNNGQVGGEHFVHSSEVLPLSTLFHC